MSRVERYVPPQKATISSVAFRTAQSSQFAFFHNIVRQRFRRLLPCSTHFYLSCECAISKNREKKIKLKRENQVQCLNRE